MLTISLEGEGSGQEGEGAGDRREGAGGGSEGTGSGREIRKWKLESRRDRK